MRKIEYYCPGCKKFVKRFRIEPNFYGPGMIVKICERCNSVLMEFVKEKRKKS
jgi:hypothetical protein